MKKLLGFVISALLVSVLFTACVVNGDSPYFESWLDTTGYVTYDENGNFKEFVKGTSTKPADQPKAILWEHRYKNTPPTFVLTPQEWNRLDIEYEDMDKTYRYAFKRTPIEINGLIFYCDDENVYVINNKYDKYKDKERRDDDEYCFKVKVYGIGEELRFLMVKNGGNGKW